MITQLHEVLPSNTCGTVTTLPKLTLKLSALNVSTVAAVVIPAEWTGTADAWKNLSEDNQNAFKTLVSASRRSFPSDDQDDWNNYLSYAFSTDPDTAEATATAFSGDWAVNAADTTDTADKTKAVTSYNKYYNATQDLDTSPVSAKASYIEITEPDNYIVAMPTSLQTAYTRYNAGTSAGSLTRLWADLSSDSDLKDTATNVDEEMTKLDKALELFKSWEDVITNYHRGNYTMEDGVTSIDNSNDRGKAIPLNYAYVSDDNVLVVPNWTWLNYYGQTGHGWLAFFCFFNHNENTSTYWSGQDLPAMKEELIGTYKLCKTVDSEWKTISDKIAAKYTTDPVLYHETEYNDFEIWTPDWAKSTDGIEKADSTAVDYSTIDFDIKKALWYSDKITPVPTTDGNSSSLGHFGVWVICYFLRQAAMATGGYDTTGNTALTNKSALTGTSADQTRTVGYQTDQLYASRERGEYVKTWYENNVKTWTYTP